MRMVWHCKYEDDRIHVFTESKDYGYYNLIQEPYCKICSYPGVDTEDCAWHEDYYGFNRLYAMGPYITSKTMAGYTDLLSKHIRGLKIYKNYAYPLGLGLSLCISNKWSELMEADFFTPIPKAESEFKIDRESEEKYNQANELAKIVSSKIGKPINYILEKLRPQSLQGLNREERQAAVKGLYTVSELQNAVNKSVILVDDVATSLSTTCECSKILIDSGASIVNVIVAGRDVIIDDEP